MSLHGWLKSIQTSLTAKNLNKYAALFKTADSGGKGAWFEGPTGYTTIGEKMVSANKLNFKVIFSGSEAALVDGFIKAEKLTRLHSSVMHGSLGHFTPSFQHLKQLALSSLQMTGAIQQRQVD